MDIRMILHHGEKVYDMPVLAGIKLAQEMNGAAEKLTFDTMKDESIPLEVGDDVTLQIDDEAIFFGKIESTSENVSDVLSCVAWSQIVQLVRSRDFYCYHDKTATEVINMILNDNKESFSVGSLDKTSYKIKNRTENGSGLLDIILTALDLELEHSKKLYCFYDDCGKLKLRDVEAKDMTLPILIDEDVAGDYSYKVSSQDMVNSVHTGYADKDTGKHEFAYSTDTKNVTKYGLRRDYVDVDDKSELQSTADDYLDIYNRLKKTLSISDVIGDTRIRAGKSLWIKLKIHGGSIQKKMLITKVTHNFNGGDDYFCDMSLWEWG